MTIHPLAHVDPQAKIGKNVTIEPFAVVKTDVTLCDNVTVKSHAYIDGHTFVGEGTTIWPGASIGTKTQDLKFAGEKTFVEIGKRCDIREYVTINASCGEGSVVRIGDGCLIMAYCHVAHNCEVGDRVIMSNGVMLAGHVIIEHDAVVGGMTPVHQYSRIGCFSMVGGFSRVVCDVPPFTIGGGFPYKMGGINLVGLKRRKFALEVRSALSKAFKLTYRSNLKVEEAMELIEKEVPSSQETKHWITFCRSSKRGLIGLQNADFEEGVSEKQEPALQET